jgi:hypothetical protein
VDHHHTTIKVSDLEEVVTILTRVVLTLQMSSERERATKVITGIQILGNINSVAEVHLITHTKTTDLLFKVEEVDQIILLVDIKIAVVIEETFNPTALVGELTSILLGEEVMIDVTKEVTDGEIEVIEAIKSTKKEAVVDSDN